MYGGSHFQPEVLLYVLGYPVLDWDWGWVCNLGR